MDGSSGAADWRSFAGDLLRPDPVLQAAAACFVDVGYHGTTVRQIARRSGLSVPGIYHHHAGKQAMLAAVLAEAMADLMSRLRAAGREGGADPVRRFDLLVRCLVLWHCHRRDLAFLAGSEMRSLDPANRRRITALRVEVQRMVDATIEQAAAADLFRTSFPHDAGRAVVTMSIGVVHWYRIALSLTPEDVADRYVGFARAVVGSAAPGEAGY